VAQKIFVAFGASNSEKAVMSRVRAPLPYEEKDPGWHAIREDDTLDEKVYLIEPSYPTDATQLYYWHATAIGFLEFSPNSGAQKSREILPTQDCVMLLPFALGVPKHSMTRRHLTHGVPLPRP
jgi:hypothetical protein